MVLNDAIGDFLREEFQNFEVPLSSVEIEMICTIVLEESKYVCAV